MNKNTKILILILVVAVFLRLYKLNDVPVSMFGDELDVGYHAYSILETGKDYSGNFMPLHFQSLAEWRTPLYLYSVVPSVAIWGISPLGVRFPAAVFGVLGVWGLYLLSNELLNKRFGFRNLNFGLLPALVLTLSPWHIQYSRAAFEVTMLLAFLLFGLYFFFRSFREGKFLWLAVVLLLTTPLIYSTAKLFMPFFLVLLVLLFKDKLLKVDRGNLKKALVAGLFAGLITSYATLFSGGEQRFGYISVFSDPTVATEVNAERLIDARTRGKIDLGISPNLGDRFYHNKLVFWVSSVSDNFLKSLSFDFLFIKGDPNPRHSIQGIGQFYKIEAIAFVLGLLFLSFSKVEKRVKILIFSWLLLGILPSSLTRGGGNHATRLILSLPVYTLLISVGISEVLKMKRLGLKVPGFGSQVLGKVKIGKFLALVYTSIFLLSFVLYQHQYWVHNPWLSERWWHAGWGEAVNSIQEIEMNYDKVFISMTGEPAWIFFAAHSEFPPDKWHAGFPMKTESVEGFGRISFIEKYLFGSPQEEEGGIYALKDYLGKSDLYLANASEVGENLILDPSRAPIGLKLIKSIAYPSGEPAFYIFTKS